MGHTNSTANLSLPQFIGTDKPTWLGDVNGAFSAIDAYAGTNDAAVAAAVSDASSAIAQAASAVSTANAANTTAGNASTAATNAVGTANNAVAIAGTVDSKVGLLADLTTTDRTSIVNAINEVNAAVGTVPTAAQVTYDNTGSGLTATNVQDAIDEVAQGGGGSTPTKRATSSSLTNSTALADLKPAFTALSESEKIRSYIKDTVNNVIFPFAGLLAGTYGSLYTTGTQVGGLFLNIDSEIAHEVTLSGSNATTSGRSSGAVTAGQYELWA